MFECDFKKIVGLNVNKLLILVWVRVFYVSQCEHINFLLFFYFPQKNEKRVIAKAITLDRNENINKSNKKQRRTR